MSLTLPSLIERLLDSNWTPTRSLWSTVPILATTALASYEAGLGNHVDGSTTWQGLTLLALLCELVGVLLAMMKYLLENLYASPEEHAARLLARWPDYRQKVIDLSKPNLTEEELDRCVKGVFQRVTLSAEAVARISLLPRLGLRLLVVFTACTMSLALWSYIGGDKNPVFGDQLFASRNCRDVAALGEQSIYTNLVTLSTVGFGDMAPRSLSGRLMVDCEILMSLFSLIFVANIIGGLLMENSGWAWSSRQEPMKIHIRKLVTQQCAVFLKVQG
jgi:energy-converting hydrogenase Eha subunit A